MRLPVSAILILSLVGCASSDQDALQPRSELAFTTPAELQIEINSPSGELYATEDQLLVDVEGAASSIGGVRFLDMMLVLDTSTSLRRTDPEDYRIAGATGLVQSLSPKSNTQIGVVGFDGNSELAQPLTADRDRVVQALQSMKKSGGTDVAAGILLALAELKAHGRPGSSRVIMLFTDGMSNRRNARDATRSAQAQGVTIQSLLLGTSKRGAEMLEEIALATGGSFVQVEDPALLPEAFLNMRTTGIDNVTLSANGARATPARLVGGTFSGTVPLRLGENRIVARATSLDEQTKEVVLNIAVHDGSCAALAVNALQDGRPTLSLDDRSVEIVVDASRSMWGQMDGEAKMTIAKQILHDASTWLPEHLSLAMRTYGSTSQSDARNCADSTLLVPFAANNRDGFREAVAALTPLGQTPIAYALNQAADDFAAVQGQRTIVLVSDGIESCGGDPIAAAAALREQGIVVHLIGFGLDNSADEDTESLQAIAAAGGGQFLTAASAAELRQALESTVGTRFEVVRADTVVATGILGSVQKLFLPKGDYRIQLESMPPHAVDVSLAPRDELAVTLNKQSGVIDHSEQRGTLDPLSCDVALAAQRHKEQQALEFTAVTPVEPSEVVAESH